MLETKDRLEERRLDAARMLRGGARQCEVARLTGVARSTVCEWNRQIRHGGLDAVRATPHGRPPRLDRADRDVLFRVLDTMAVAGSSPARWPLDRVGGLVDALFGVRYSTSQLCRLRKDWKEQAMPSRSAQPRSQR